MTTKAALLALLAIWGVGDCIPAAAMAADDVAHEQSDSEQSDSSPIKRSFTNRVWVKADSGDLAGRHAHFSVRWHARDEIPAGKPIACRHGT